jgi:hypothetical protein
VPSSVNEPAPGLSPPAELAERYGSDPDGLAAALVSLVPIFGDLAGDTALTGSIAARLSQLVTP